MWGLEDFRIHRVNCKTNSEILRIVVQDVKEHKTNPFKAEFYVPCGELPSLCVEA